MVDAARKLAAATLSTYDIGKWDSPTPQMLQEMSSLSRSFDGTRQHFDQLTQGMPVNALEQFRATNNREMNLQKIAADQSANHIFNIKDKTLFSLLNKSVQDKAEGKSSTPEKQVQEYLENKQKTIDGFLDQKLKSATEDPQKNQKAPGGAEIEKVTVMMRDDADTGTWEKATEGWDANGLNNLRASAGTMMQQNIYSGGQAASLAAQVEDKQMLQLLATAKPASGPDDKGEATQKITQDLDAYARARETQINEWTQAARSKPVTGMTRPAAAPVEASVSAGGNYDRLRSTENRMKEALGRMEESRPLSNVDCKTAMNNSAQGGTTTVTAGGRLNVSPADIRQGAKDILTKPREDWPDLTKWDRRSLETLRGDVSQELGNQLNEARQVVHAIRAGGDAGLAEGIKNPDIRERVQESAHSGMSVVDANVLNQEMSRAASTRREDVSSEISMQIRAIAEEQRNNRAPAINCAPGA